MKLVYVFALVCLLGLGFGVVGAEIIAEYPYSAYTGASGGSVVPQAVHPSSSSTRSALYQAFRVSYNETLLENITIVGVRVGNPNCVLRMALYSASGAEPNIAPNALIETSGTDFNPNTLTVGVISLVTWDFAGTTELLTGTDYTWVLYESSETTCDGSNNLDVHWDATAVGGGAPGYYGNAGTYHSSAWNVITGSDFVFQVGGSGGIYTEYVDIGEYTINNFDEVTTIDSPNVDYIYLVGLFGVIGVSLVLFKLKLGVVGLVWGIFGIAIAATLAGNQAVPFYPYLTLGVAVVGVLLVLYSGYEMRGA